MSDSARWVVQPPPEGAERYTLRCLMESVDTALKDDTDMLDNVSRTAQGIRDFAADWADSFVGGAAWFQPSDEQVIGALLANPYLLRVHVSDDVYRDSVLSDPFQRTVRNMVLVALFACLVTYIDLKIRMLIAPDLVIDPDPVPLAVLQSER